MKFCIVISVLLLITAVRGLYSFT